MNNMEIIIRKVVYPMEEDYKKLLGNDSKCKLSIQDVDKSARILCKAIAGVNGKSMGEIFSEAIWETASKTYAPCTIKQILERNDIDFKI